jgi:hypothetical protein
MNSPSVKFYAIFLFKGCIKAIVHYIIIFPSKSVSYSYFYSLNFNGSFNLHFIKHNIIFIYFKIYVPSGIVICNLVIHYISFLQKMLSEGNIYTKYPTILHFFGIYYPYLSYCNTFSYTVLYFFIQLSYCEICSTRPPFLFFQIISKNSSLLWK